MSDLRNRMERLGDRALAELGAFERLERRRTRKVRNRKIGAGVLALVLTLGGSVAAFSAFRSGDEPTIGGVEADDGFYALWPEQTEAGLAAAQERVDGGDEGFAWRSDPIEVARAFALEKLLWPSAEIEIPDGTDLEGDDVIFLELGVPPEQVACDQIVSDATCPTSRTTVRMERLGSDNRLWSIVEVHGDDLALPLVAGQELAAGSTIVLPTNLADGEKVSMGVAFLTACDASGVDENVEAVAGTLEFDVPAVSDGCTGYVYAMRPKTGVGAVAIGSFLFAGAEEVPGIGYLVEEIAAVPVRFVPEGSTGASVPDVARVVCLGSDITVETPVVRAQPDGFHITVVNQGDEEVSFSVFQNVGLTPEGAGDVAVSSGAGGGNGAPPGESSSVWTYPPGTYSLSCAPTPEPGEAGVAGIGKLEVVDPDGHYVPAELECATGEAYGSGAAYAAGGDDAEPTGFAGDPVQVARDHVFGIEFDDVVERAGYPESEQPIIRIVRDGAVVGKVTLRDDGSGSWLDDTVEGCGGTQFGWSEDITGVSGPIGETGGGSLGDPGSGSLPVCAMEAGGNNIHEGADVHIDQENLEFDTACLIMPAGEPLTILFSNLGDGIPSNISIHPMTPCLSESLSHAIPTGCPSGELDSPIFVGETITGVSEIVYEFGPLEHGEYYVQDDIHPMSRGVLIVESAR